MAKINKKDIDIKKSGLEKPGANKAEIEEFVEGLKKNPILKDFSDEQLKAVATSALVEVREEFFSSFSGPLPPPTILKQYEEIILGAANRILVMAEENANDRRRINQQIIDADIGSSSKGQTLGFILSVLFIIAAVICSFVDQPIPASFLGVGGFSSIVSIFVLGKK